MTLPSYLNAMLSCLGCLEAGIGISGIRPQEFEAIVTNYLVDQPMEEPHGAQVQVLQGLHIFVCTHGTRDSR